MKAVQSIPLVQSHYCILVVEIHAGIWRNYYFSFTQTDDFCHSVSVYKWNTTHFQPSCKTPASR